LPRSQSATLLVGRWSKTLPIDRQRHVRSGTVRNDLPGVGLTYRPSTWTSSNGDRGTSGSVPATTCPGARDPTALYQCLTLTPSAVSQGAHSVPTDPPATETARGDSAAEWKEAVQPNEQRMKQTLETTAISLTSRVSAIHLSSTLANFGGVTERAGRDTSDHSRRSHARFQA
jgi:hypothetical protein